MGFKLGSRNAHFTLDHRRLPLRVHCQSSFILGGLDEPVLGAQLIASTTGYGVPGSRSTAYRLVQDADRLSLSDYALQRRPA